jgi:large subunit ribosomal protein L2
MQTLLQRRFAHCYSPIIKRNRVPFVNFETGAPTERWRPKQQTLAAPFTPQKQERILTSVAGRPERLFHGRVIHQLSTRKIQFGGRNMYGQMTVRRRGGGTRQRLRLIDFKRGRKDVPATVLRLEHAPCRTAHVALIQYVDGVLSYVIAPMALRPGDVVIASETAAISPGNALPLRQVPVGTIVHCVEERPGAGGVFMRAAGTYGTVLSKDEVYATIRLNSTEIRLFDLDCWATIGQVSNRTHWTIARGKAGVSRWLGERPQVKGTKMDPDTHPHGGGTSAKRVKRPPVTYWGQLTKGFKTRSNRPQKLVMQRQLMGKLKKRFSVSR